MANNAVQREEAMRPNNTGMPDNLKSGIESLSGFSMNDVRVHYNSSKPATVQALAYTQGTDIHVAPGQEKHLPHEAWHVAQQMAGRVSPTTNINGMPVNDNASLEHEADVMGEKAVAQQKNGYTQTSRETLLNGIIQNKMITSTIQLAVDKDLLDNDENIKAFMDKNYDLKHYSAGSNGVFDVIYNPKKHCLDVTLPVFYKPSMDEAKKKFFIENIKNTWNDKYDIKFTEARLNPTGSTPKKADVGQTESKTWEKELKETIQINIEVQEKDNKDDAYFVLKTISGGSSVKKSKRHTIPGASILRGKVHLRDTGFKVGSPSGSFKSLNPTAHEVGHMFGLGDEYVVKNKKKGDKATHYQLTEKAFGTTEADKLATMDKNSDPASKRKGTTIMRNGDKVEKHHYVTFWDAMVKAIQSVYREDSSEKAPNMHKDWTITEK